MTRTLAYDLCVRERERESDFDHLRNCRQLLNTVTLVLTWHLDAFLCYAQIAHIHTPLRYVLTHK